MDEAATELVRDWLTRAAHDLRSARVLAALADPLLDVAIYHCQQTAEKSVKAWLQQCAAPFPRTHDISDLVKLATQSDAGFMQLADAASVLTPYATAFRYPGGTFEAMPSPEEFATALKHAEQIFQFVIERLPVEARPSPSRYTK